MNPAQLGALALLLGALGCALFAALACLRVAAQRRSARTLEGALAVQAAASEARAAAMRTAMASAAASGPSAASMAAPAGQARAPGAFDGLARLGTRWLDTSFGKMAVAEEDRRLLDQCGYTDARSRSLFLVARLVLACVLAAVVAWIAGTRASAHPFVWACAGLVAGFLVPKFVLRRRAAARLEAVADELPMLVDLLRLLQGVGLSLDQSVQVLLNEFRNVLPVLGSELEIAQRQFVTGRTREQSLQRMATIYENEDLRAVIRLLVQVDRHGGAVQEPLRQFGDRLRELRRATLRERIGRVTVKMTGVMVLTLLPALLIATAGPGAVAVMHSLSSIHSLHHRP
ncbi:type II secretion system F family protein [Paraburkholderia acidisoli]|uniref:Type II secretion system F family protein n=1 Tax=Paraburkholderia acidisoli TaxID=2571748 RepID=A0A7Z2GHQ8_9BURK|nr:type II secretion system F family protein [Paraburkholderia acidisoli]QGZ61694.1 type II secretion system F family protein [Paraburkholderia acidisoli]